MSKISTKLLMAVISAQVLLQFHFTQDFGHLGDGEVLITNMSFNLNFKKNNQCLTWSNAIFRSYLNFLTDELIDPHRYSTKKTLIIEEAGWSSN